MGRDGGDVDIAAKVSRQVAKVGALLDDRATTVMERLSRKHQATDEARTIPLRLVPPVWLCNCFICARIARDCGHYLKIVGLYNLLDHLYAFQVT